MDARLTALRNEMLNRNIDVLFVPRGDAFQGEEVPASEDRLHYISGFSGSAGTAIITNDQAALFSDGRYTIQMQAETSDEWSCHTVPDVNMLAWMKDHLPAGNLGIDPWLLSLGQWRDFTKKFADTAFSLSILDGNLIDAIWPDRPSPPHQPAWDYPLQYSGKSRQDKIDDVAAHLKEMGADQILITGPDQLNWLLNIRGNDIDHSPLFLSFALMNIAGEVTIFAEADRLNAIDHAGITAVSPMDMLDHLASLRHTKIAIDPATCPYVLAKILDGNTVEAASIITTLKAEKNETEVAGFHAAHQRDAVAMVRFLAWLDAAPKDSLREAEAADQLLAFRAEVDGFISTSFATICGSGANGAIVHYRAEPGKDAVIKDGTLCLIDSGGQYLDATTDITRTVAVGTPTDQMRHDFSHVLKAHIALDRAIFPEGTTGVQLDAITRAPLWAAGMDYAHGTGHGVGCCSNVHEGPQNISKRGMVPIKAGMVTSNEPGYYIEGQYGIRIENLVVAVSASAEGDEGYLKFDHVTLVPMDKRLIDVAYLDDEEIAWVNDYHAKVQQKIKPLINQLGDEAVSAWFAEATRPI